MKKIILARPLSNQNRAPSSLNKNFINNVVVNFVENSRSFFHNTLILIQSMCTVGKCLLFVFANFFG